MNAENTLLHKYQSIKRGLMGDLLGGKKTLGERGDVVSLGCDHSYDVVETPCMASLWSLDLTRR